MGNHACACRHSLQIQPQEWLPNSPPPWEWGTSVTYMSCLCLVLIVGLKYRGTKLCSVYDGVSLLYHIMWCLVTHTYALPPSPGLPHDANLALANCLPSTCYMASNDIAHSQLSGELLALLYCVAVSWKRELPWFRVVRLSVFLSYIRSKLLCW